MYTRQEIVRDFDLANERAHRHGWSKQDRQGISIAQPGNVTGRPSFDVG